MSKSKRPIYASDTHAWDHCRRQAWFLFHPPSAESPGSDRFHELIKNMGDEHEAEVLDSFEAAVEANSTAHTQALIAERTPVIYQPKFRDDDQDLLGTPDFLLLSDEGYQIADAKLALSVEKNRAILAQLGIYQRLLANSQDAAGNEQALPNPLVFLGDGEAFEVDLEIAELATQFLRDMQNLKASGNKPDAHFAYSKCSACVFLDLCLDEFESTDDLTLSPAIDARTAAQLKQQHFDTLSSVAQAQPEDILEAPFLRNPDKRLRIIQQAQSLKSGNVIQREPPAWPSGTFVHFDIETDPMGANGGGEVYLWGLLKPPYDEQAFDAVWKDSDDFAAWQDFLVRIEVYRERWPDLVLVHYSPYERTLLQQYALRYQQSQDPLVSWLLAEDGPLWDLQAFIKRYFVLPVKSYGLKAICRDPRLANFQWRLPESGSQWSVVRYYDYVVALAEGRVDEAAAIRDEVLIYNEDDVRATAAVIDWLQALDNGIGQWAD